MVRNKTIYEKIARELVVRGYEWVWEKTERSKALTQALTSPF